MANAHADQESQVLLSFAHDLCGEIRVLREGRDHRNYEYRQSKRSEAADLNFRHPAYGVIGRQIDAAAVLVRAFEDYLNREGTFCIPLHLDLGMLCAPTETDPNYRSDYNTTDWTTDPGTHYALAIIRSNDSWRITIYRWTIFGTPKSEPQERGTASCKPWLESSYLDKAVTILHLPKLVDKLLTQVQLMARVAAGNASALSKLGDIVKSLPNQ